MYQTGKRLFTSIRVLVIIICLSITIISCDKDNDPDFFEKTIGLPLDDNGRFMSSTSDGGFIICGSTNSVYHFNVDMLFVKIDRHGDIMWMKTIGGIKTAEDDIAYSVIETGDHHYLATGAMYIEGRSLDAVALKLNATGQMVWIKTFGNADRDIAYKAVPVDNGGSLIIGTTKTGWSSLLYDIFITRLNSQGDTMWTKLIGKHKYTEYGFSGISSAPNQFTITGFSNYNFGGIFTPFLLTLDQNGNELSTSLIEQPDDCFMYDIVDTDDHGFLLAGRLLVSRQFGIYAPYIIKTDSEGNNIWNGYYGLNSRIASLNSIIKLNDGTFLTVGTVFVEGKNNQIYLLKLSTDGEIIWERNYGGTDDESGYSVHAEENGSIYVIGKTKPVNKTNADLYIVKVDRDGNLN